MNLLVLFVRDHPEAVDQLVEGERITETAVSVESVAAVVERFRFPVHFDRQIVTSFAEGPFGELFRNAYLRVVPAERWQSQVGEAVSPRAMSKTPPRGLEWVTFAGGTRTNDGVTLPDDGDRSTLRLSLFAPADGSVRRVSIEYGGMERPTGASASVVRGCSLPDWGECAGEECGGDCTLELVHGDAYGLRCHCPHELEEALAYEAAVPQEHPAFQEQLTW